MRRSSAFLVLFDALILGVGCVALIWLWLWGSTGVEPIPTLVTLQVGMFAVLVAALSLVRSLALRHAELSARAARPPPEEFTTSHLFEQARREEAARLAAQVELSRQPGMYVYQPGRSMCPRHPSQPLAIHDARTGMMYCNICGSRPS